MTPLGPVSSQTVQSSGGRLSPRLPSSFNLPSECRGLLVWEFSGWLGCFLSVVVLFGVDRWSVGLMFLKVPAQWTGSAGLGVRHLTGEPGVADSRGGPVAGDAAGGSSCRARCSARGSWRPVRDVVGYRWVLSRGRLAAVGYLGIALALGFVVFGLAGPGLGSTLLLVVVVQAVVLLPLGWAVVVAVLVPFVWAEGAPAAPRPSPSQRVARHRARGFLFEQA
jgi:hypothetical protein